jgi:hypothetical protein
MQQMAAAAIALNGHSQLACTRGSRASLKAFRLAAMEILAKEGLGGFYSGIIPNTIQVSCPFPNRNGRKLSFSQAPLLCYHNCELAATQ